MRAVRLSSMQLLRLVRQDMMLLAACLAPVLAGSLIRWIVPVLEESLRGWLSLPCVLSPYYGIFDIFLSMLTPIMFCFAAAMVTLEETDDHISAYLFVTSLGKTGYLVSRIFVPAAAAFLVTMVLLPLSRLTDMNAAHVTFLSAAGALQGIVMVMLIVTLSSNKLEGMAVTKLSTLTILGVMAPYFLPEGIQYLLWFLPSYWTVMVIFENRLIFIVPAIFTYLVWIGVLIKGFVKKIS